MRVTAWNNGKHYPSGAGYGVKIAKSDRDKYFSKAEKSVIVELPNGVKVEVNTDKHSFWDETCRELIKKEIGKWLRDSGKAPWPHGSPPKLELTPQDKRNFVLNCIDSRGTA